jgi:D-lyxose ketol-isomerase
MKRSRINQLIQETIIYFKSMNFNLPDFAYYTITDWKKVVNTAQEIFDLGLGWDITDFGLGDFDNTGLILFTLRNGSLTNRKYPKSYAEKIMLVKVGQFTPYHYHWHKVEDIINRGGGDLLFKLANSTPDDGLDESLVEIVVDGIIKTIRPGEEFVLHPGQSIALPQKMYHTFWGRNKDVLVGEVSMINDDSKDNRFYENLPRFSEIEEDEEIKYLLITDYKNLLSF